MNVLVSCANVYTYFARVMVLTSDNADLPMLDQERALVANRAVGLRSDRPDHRPLVVVATAAAGEQPGEDWDAAALVLDGAVDVEESIRVADDSGAAAAEVEWAYPSGLYPVRVFYAPPAATDDIEDGDERWLVLLTV